MLIPFEKPLVVASSFGVEEAILDFLKNFIRGLIQIINYKLQITNYKCFEGADFWGFSDTEIASGG